MRDVILQGNCIDTLKTIPADSVDCCITSPPYYGLRDYGTGEWIGGNPDCDHVANPSATKKQGNSEFNENRPCREETKTAGYYKSICPKCGAIREDKQIGLEETPEEYINRLVQVFQEVKRVLKPEGTLWVNIGDSYNNAKVGNTEVNKHKCVVTDSFRKKMWSGAKQKDLIGIPWLLAFALRNDGWYLRQDIIWHKPNPMPESVKDRCTKSHEYIFLLSKSPKYYFDFKAIQEPVSRKDTTGICFGGVKYSDNQDVKFEIYSGNDYINDGTRNRRDVWSVVPSHYKEAHFATFPEELVEPMILAGCPKGGIVLDPFMGSGTTGAVAVLNKRHYIGCELNPEYIELSNRRIADATKIANQVTISDLFENQVTISDLFTERTETE